MDLLIQSLKKKDPMPQVGFEPTPSEDDCNLSATP
jgi:hypothetical protein